MDSLLGLKFLGVCLLDVVVGDPRCLPHPVRLMGCLIQLYEQHVVGVCSTASAKKGVGVILAIGLPVGCFWMVQLCLEAAENIHAMLGGVLWILFGFTTLAARDLWDHAMCVYRALVEGELPSARLAVNQVVGRDTTYLSEPDIVRATLESVAENSSDGIVAPLFYLALGGPPFAMAYKAVNTLDSMIGYRNARYEDFGWASARLDDVLNWIPARLTALGMSLAAAVRLGQGRSAWRIAWRDARKHPSPNSGWPEAAMAGALGIQLGGVNAYGGRIEERATLGDSGVPLQPSLIPLALQVMELASIAIVLMLLALLMGLA